MPKGIYKRSAEACANISKSKSGANHPFFGKKRPEHSKRMTGKNNPNSGGKYCHGFEVDHEVSKETRLKLSNAAKEYTHGYQKGHDVSDKIRNKISKSKLGVSLGPHSDETVEKIRKSHIGIPAPKGSGTGKSCYYNSPLQGKIWIRSTYELAYAQYLDSKRILWKHEHKRFKLSNGTTYAPDFFLVKSKKYREIKGYMRPEAQEKVELFQNEYPNKDFKVLYYEDLVRKGIKI